jgi:pimeloyl-ACP methyl ester carboxylesterase
MKIVPTRWLEIGYEEFGDPTGLPVLLLHGFPDDAVRAWDGVIRQLSHERVRMITPYLRGFGPTLITAPEAVSGQLAALGQDVLDLADSLHIERFVIVGQDWGARAAYAAAALAPARIIFLLCLATPYVMFGGKNESPAQARAFWYQWYFNLDRGREAFAADPKSFCEYLWRVWSPRWEFSTAEFAATSAAWSNPQFVDVVIHYYRHRYGNASGSGVYTAQQAILVAQPVIRVPTVFACGTADACNLPESSLGQECWFANGYERVEVEGAGHFIQREDPGLIAALLQRQNISHFIRGE